MFRAETPRAGPDYCLENVREGARTSFFREKKNTGSPSQLMATHPSETKKVDDQKSCPRCMWPPATPRACFSARSTLALGTACRHCSLLCYILRWHQRSASVLNAPNSLLKTWHSLVEKNRARAPSLPTDRPTEYDMTWHPREDRRLGWSSHSFDRLANRCARGAMLKAESDRSGIVHREQETNRHDAPRRELKQTYDMVYNEESATW